MPCCMAMLHDEEECLLGASLDETTGRRHTPTLKAVQSQISGTVDDGRKSKFRNLVGFWFLGLCNNFAYVVMLAAAVDIIRKFDDGKANEPPDINKCTPASAGTILLADILPALLIKICGPFINANTHVQVALVVCLSAGSFILTSVSTVRWLAFLGVIAASLGSGLGELTFLKYSSCFDKNVVSAWSSGTGAAGVLGATLYTLIALAIPPEETLLIMLVVPVILAISFWIILEHPPKPGSEVSSHAGSSNAISGSETSRSLQTVSQAANLTFTQKVRLIKPLLKYMIPLGLVYFAEYFINQGLTELILFDNGIPVETQYRWYQVSYQVGVLISRSSVNILQIHKLWLLPVLQFANAIFFTCEALYRFVPSFYVIVTVIVFEGLLGGASYVNTFYKISQEVSPQYREFSMGVTSLADSLGITISAFAAIWAHNLICTYRETHH